MSPTPCNRRSRIDIGEVMRFIGHLLLLPPHEPLGEYVTVGAAENVLFVGDVEDVLFVGDAEDVLFVRDAEEEAMEQMPNPG